MNYPIPRKSPSMIIVFRNKLLHLVARHCISNKIRIFLFKLSGVKIGRNVFIGIETFLDDQFPHLIKIEEGCVIAFRVILVVHDITPRLKPIIVKKNSYIGCGSIILPGVVVNENSFVAAGSVVTKDIPSGCVYGGVPAKFIKNMSQDIKS